MTTSQFNTRLPGFTHDQIDLLVETYGLTKTQVVILAIDRLIHDLHPDNYSRSGLSAKYEVSKLQQETE